MGAFGSGWILGPLCSGLGTVLEGAEKGGKYDPLFPMPNEISAGGEEGTRNGSNGPRGGVDDSEGELPSDALVKVGMGGPWW